MGQGNVFTGVCDSVHRGVSASVHAGIPHPPSRPPRADTPQGRYPLGAATPRSRHPPGSRLWDTVNKWLVRILLECILVSYMTLPHPLTHILTHPSTQPPIHPPIGGGVSANHKSSNTIELSQLGPNFNF